MGQPLIPPPVLLIVAAFSRHDDALAWARRRTAEAWGEMALASAAFPFAQTDYYTPTMGPELKKQFLAFAAPFDSAALAAVKRQTNQWEEEFAAAAGLAEPRPLNLDPGYIAPGKLVLASTKDFAHRIYLGAGIYAEVTLFFRRGQWQPHEFTFADYRQAEYHEFFTRCRDWLRRQPWSHAAGPR